MWLKKDEFLDVVDRTPLVSIELLVQRVDGAVLLGRRKNRPAQGNWCVPGGRIRKDETIREALRRIVTSELGEAVPIDGWEPFGFWEHHYLDNFADQEGIRTHYVVLAHKLQLGTQPVRIEADDQHESLRWWTGRLRHCSPMKLCTSTPRRIFARMYRQSSVSYDGVCMLSHIGNTGNGNG